MVSEKRFACPSCGVPLLIKFWGYGIDKCRCMECGADLIFDHDQCSCKVSLGFMRSGRHGPILSLAGVVNGGRI